MLPGGYTCLNTWLAKQDEHEIEVPSGVVKIVFDNEQVVGKRYTVKSTSKNDPINVVTSHIIHIN